MYEFRVRVGFEIGEVEGEIERGEQSFIITAESENELDAEDQIRYLIENKMEVVGLIFLLLVFSHNQLILAVGLLFIANQLINQTISLNNTLYSN